MLGWNHDQRGARGRPEDVDEICGGLPETWFGTSWGDVPTWLVPHRDKGRGFVLYRKPHKSAIDPETGELYEDLLVIRTANADDKQALVDGTARSSPSTTSRGSTPCSCSSPASAS